MRNCFVPFCDNISKDKPRRCMFHPPKNMYEIWKTILPKLKEFKPSDKVCERHFQESDVIRNFEQVINGEVVRLERGRARLKPNAIPTLNLPEEKEIQHKLRRNKSLRPSLPSESQKRSIIKRRNSSTNDETDSTKTATTIPIPMKKIQKSMEEITNKDENRKECEGGGDEENENEIIISNEILENIYSNSALQQQYDSLYDDVYEVTLPNTLWGVHRDIDRSYIVFTYFDCKYLKTTKSIIISSKGEFKIKIFDKLLSDELISDISHEIISEIINEIDEIQICKNISKNDKCRIKIESDNENLCAECKSELS